MRMRKAIDKIIAQANKETSMLEFTLRRKIARVIKQLTETLDISPSRALCLFYSTDT